MKHVMVHGLLFFLTASAWASYDPQPMPVMPAEKQEHQFSTSDPFSQIYQTAGRPKMTFFINERLGHTVEQWTSSQRFRIVKNSQYQETGSKQSQANMGEETIMAVETRQPQAVEDPQISLVVAGLFNQLRQSGVRLVDNNTLQQVERSNHSNKQHLISAIQKHADLFVEMNIVPASSNSLFTDVQVINPNNGEIVTRFALHLDGTFKQKTVFKATSKGFVKTTVDDACEFEYSQACLAKKDPNTLKGQQLATALIEHLTVGLQ